MIKRGFTLIELLVVVLIIGILTAIALPSYQNSVLHSRYAQLEVTASAIQAAAKQYFIATSRFPTSFEDLDYQFQGKISSGGTLLTQRENTCQYLGLNEQGDSPLVCYLTKMPEIGLLVFYNKDSRYCLAAQTSEIARTFCETFGGEEDSSIIEAMAQYTIP